MPRSSRRSAIPRFATSSRISAFAVRGSSAAELGVMTREQLAKYARVIKEMGIANE